MAAVLAGIAVIGLDSAVNVDFPLITARFGLAISEIQWIVVSYTLTSASLILVFGRIGDIAGHRRLFRLGAGASVLAFMVCAAAPAFGVLLAGRVIQGIGAGLLMACGPALSTQVYPEGKRARALSLYTAGLAGAGAIGPVLGGAMLAHFGWASVFWMRIPLAFAALVLAAGLPRGAAAPRSSGRAFDWAGAAWLVACLAALVLAIGSARTMPAVAAPAALLAIIAAVAFIRTQRGSPAPIIRLAVFRLPGFALLTLASVALNLAGFAILLLVPFALALDLRLPEAARGILLALAPATLATTAALGSRAVSLGRTWPLVLGAGLMALGLAGCALGSGSVLLLAAGMVVVGGGQGFFQVAYLDVTTGRLPPGERGVAGSLAMLTRTLGLVLGATVLMLVFSTLEAGRSGADAFGAAFQGTLICAAALPAALTLLWLLIPPPKGSVAE